MKSTFNRSNVIAQLKAIKKNHSGQVTDGHGTSRAVWCGSSGLFVYENRPDMAPKSLGAMADLICNSSQVA